MYFCRLAFAKLQGKNDSIDHSKKFRHTIVFAKKTSATARAIKDVYTILKRNSNDNISKSLAENITKKYSVAFGKSYQLDDNLSMKKNANPRHLISQAVGVKHSTHMPMTTTGCTSTTKCAQNN